VKSNTWASGGVCWNSTGIWSVGRGLLLLTVATAPIVRYCAHTCVLVHVRGIINNLRFFARPR
jgi:hypothetical protein